MTRLILLFALVASAIGLFWHEMGRPSPVPPAPLAEGQKLNCLSYAPFHGSQAPFDQPLRIPDDDLYQLADLPTPGPHLLHLTVPRGTSLYSFTFG